MPLTADQAFRSRSRLRDVTAFVEIDMGVKAPDETAIPLCRRISDEHHRMGAKCWEAKYGTHQAYLGQTVALLDDGQQKICQHAEYGACQQTEQCKTLKPQPLVRFPAFKRHKLAWPHRAERGQKFVERRVHADDSKAPNRHRGNRGHHAER